jgi:hypothetical protein
MFAPPDSRVTLETLSADGEYAVITWHMTFPGSEAKFGTDTFLVSDGKIVFQSAAFFTG